MRHIIAQETENLTKTDKIKPHSALFGASVDDPQKRALTTNADGSRDYDDSVVVLAFVVGADVMRAHFFFVNEGQDHLSAFDMTGARTTLFHSHNFIEFAYVAEGTLRLIINGETVEFEPGDICLMDRNAEHAELMGEETAKLVYISLSSELFESIVDADKAENHEERYLRSVMLQKKESYQFVRFRPISEAPETAKTMLAILREAAGKRPGSQHIIKGYVIRFLHLLTEEHTFSLERTEKVHLRHQLYLDICAYTKKHCAEASISGLIEKFHYNRDYFNRIIKEFSGMTYTEFLHDVRLKKAGKMLVETELPIYSVAAEVGYHNLGYFYKIFRKRHGILPNEYRHLAKESLSSEHPLYKIGK